MMTTGIITTTGDVIAQQLIDRKGWDHDWERSGKMAAIGVMFVAPMWRTWFLSLDKIVPGAKPIDVFKKLLLDQLLFHPFFNANYIAVVHAVNGHSFKQIVDHVKISFWRIQLSGYSFWPLVQFVNFFAVPLCYRVPFMNSFGIIWNSYLSWSVNKRNNKT